MSRNNTPPIIAGFTEGLVAPVLELLFSTFIAALSTVGSTAGAPNLFGLVLLLSIIDVIRNIGLGLSKSQFALGNLIGSIFGLGLFYGTISSISPEAAIYSLFLTIILAASWIVGIYVWFQGNQENNYW